MEQLIRATLTVATFEWIDLFARLGSGLEEISFTCLDNNQHFSNYDNMWFSLQERVPAHLKLDCMIPPECVVLVPDMLDEKGISECKRRLERSWPTDSLSLASSKEMWTETSQISKNMK